MRKVIARRALNYYRQRPGGNRHFPKKIPTELSPKSTTKQVYSDYDLFADRFIWHAIIFELSWKNACFHCCQYCSSWREKTFHSCPFNFNQPECLTRRSPLLLFMDDIFIFSLLLKCHCDSSARPRCRFVPFTCNLINTKSVGEALKVQSLLEHLQSVEYNTLSAPYNTLVVLQCPPGTNFSDVSL